MPKIGIIGAVRDSALARLQARADVELVQVPDGDLDTVAPAVRGASGLLVRTSKLTPELLETAPALSVVSRHGVGYDNVPLDYLNARRVPLCVAASSNKIAVAEHAIHMALSLVRHAAALDEAVRKDDWGARLRTTLAELFDKHLLIVGFGRIGREVAVRARAFGMNVFVFDPYVGDDPIETAGCQRAALLEAAVTSADIVSLHLPLSAQTRGMFGKDLLARMKPDALLINTARGGIVDETALFDALNNGALAGAGLDVLEQEPPPADHPLFSCRNLILSPHVAGVTNESLERMGLEAAQNIIDIMDGRPDPAVIINAEACGIAQ